MDENNNYEERETREHYHHYHEDCWLCHHPVLKHIITALMVLLGSYLAFYTLADWHFKRMLDPAVQMRRIEKNMMREQNQIERMYKKDFERGIRLGEQTSGYIHLEKKDDAYEIIVNLRPFDNNEKNVEVSTDGGMLTVTAAGEQTTRRHDKMIKVMQQYDFDEDVDFSKIKKEKKGDNYIITVPFKK